MSDVNQNEERVIREVRKGTVGREEVPEFPVDLFKRACVHLSEEEIQMLAGLLVEFQDVFAKDDLDLGCFTEIRHQINTRDALPIRQRMRRTLLGFEKEEDHLQSVRCWVDPAF